VLNRTLSEYQQKILKKSTFTNLQKQKKNLGYVFKMVYDVQGFNRTGGGAK
jgi:hypothetical protein